MVMYGEFVISGVCCYSELRTPMMTSIPFRLVGVGCHLKFRVARCANVLLRVSFLTHNSIIAYLV